jgi:hypothetical protein
MWTYVDTTTPMWYQFDWLEEDALTPGGIHTLEPEVLTGAVCWHYVCYDAYPGGDGYYNGGTTSPEGCPEFDYAFQTLFCDEGMGWCLLEMDIAGKKDHSEPSSIASITGNLKDSGWYNTAVTITVTATDSGSGVKEIHYRLDGVETVVPGDTATVTVSTNGDHTFEYWAVDNMGNVETTHGMLTFKIDKGAAPTVSITEPTPGLYLFGKKLLSASKIIIIGGFTVEATASDADSGVYAVEFFLDGESIGSDVQGPDYTAYCGIKNSGAATIKAVAEDFAQNTAEDTLDIVYYKFF